MTDLFCTLRYPPWSVTIPLQIDSFRHPSSFDQTRVSRILLIPDWPDILPLPLISSQKKLVFCRTIETDEKLFIRVVALRFVDVDKVSSLLSS